MREALHPRRRKRRYVSVGRERVILSSMWESLLASLMVIAAARPDWGCWCSQRWPAVRCGCWRAWWSAHHAGNQNLSFVSPWSLSHIWMLNLPTIQSILNSGGFAALSAYLSRIRRIIHYMDSMLRISTSMGFMGGYMLYNPLFSQVVKVDTRV